MKEKNATSKYIKEIMKERGLKIKDVAEKIGYSHAMLSYMLNDERTIKDTDVLRVATVLGVTPNKLFGISSDTEMPVEITIRAKSEKIAGLLTEMLELKNRKG
ncbi:MAG: helix-turn-helix transcriptional regulator [Ruminococcus sp.]|nr:helix-turn-helix transcriptional regulator [Ruminococcus sp.]